jgi:glucose/mannose-6-phosphate isomerase
MDARDFFGYKNPDEEPGRPDPDDGTDSDRVPLFEDAVTLDDPAALRRIDPEDMLGKVSEMPRQLAQARRVAATLAPDPRLSDVDAVIVLAMGGSAIGAELVAAAAGDRLRVPLLVHRDYGLPAGAGERTLIVAASHSGETAETLSGFAAARQLGLPTVAITTGGRLAASATEAGMPVLEYQLGGQPRAAIGYGVGLVHELLSRLGLVREPDPIASAVSVTEDLVERLGPSVETDANPAKQLAWAIFGRTPIVYGHGPMAAVAHRWKTQFNENAKVPAFCNQLPEATHNELAGWGQDGDVTRQVFQLILLRHDFEHPQVMRRFDLVDEYLDEVVGAVHTVRAEGEGLLAQLFDLALFGDMTSLHAAAEQDVDPGPIPVLDDIKRRVADPG